MKEQNGCFYKESREKAKQQRFIAEIEHRKVKFEIYSK